MNDGTLERLSKVIALSDSAHDGEALAAFRATRQMLRHDGVDLSSVLNDAVKNRAAFARPSIDVVTALQREIMQLQRRVATLQRDLREQQQEAQHWRKLAEKK